MSEAVLVALITGGLTLLGTVISVRASQKKTEDTIKTELAVMQNNIVHLSKEVEKHNKFAERIPKLEAREDQNEKAIERLESFHME